MPSELQKEVAVKSMMRQFGIRKNIAKLALERSDWNRAKAFDELLRLMKGERIEVYDALR